MVLIAAAGGWIGCSWVENTERRRTLRAAMIALMTPTVVALPGRHGAMLLPAAWVLAYSLAAGDLSAIALGGLSLLLVFGVAWCVWSIIAVIREKAE